MNEPTYRDLGLQAAFKSAGNLAIEAHKMAAICRTSGDPEIIAAADHYEAIGEIWAAKANRILALNPQPASRVEEER